VGEFAARHWRGIYKTTKAVRNTANAVRDSSRGLSDLGAKATDPAVRRNLKATAEAFATVAARARKLGLEQATHDKKLNKDLAHALDHATKVATSFRTKKKTHRLRWLVVVSALLAGGYAEWFRRSKAR
jgi:hypothetical protein